MDEGPRRTSLHSHPTEAPGRDAGAPPTTPAEEESVRAHLTAESPEGRPPTARVRRRSTVAFVGALAVVAIGIFTSLYVWGGLIPALVASLLVLLFVGLAAWPVWTAAAARGRDRGHARREVIHERPADLSRPPPLHDR